MRINNIVWSSIITILFQSSPTFTAVQIVEPSQFEQVIQQHYGPTVVQFAASWCGVCTKIKDHFNTLAASSADHNKAIIFMRVEPDDALTKKYNIPGFPTFIFFNNGKEVHRKVGVDTIKTFQADMMAILKEHHLIT